MSLLIAHWVCGLHVPQHYGLSFAEISACGSIVCSGDFSQDVTGLRWLDDLQCLHHRRRWAFASYGFSNDTRHDTESEFHNSS